MAESFTTCDITWSEHQICQKRFQGQRKGIWATARKWAINAQDGLVIERMPRASGPQQIIATSANGTYGVYAGDMDEDGDLDVLSASCTDDKIAWYENTPPPTLAPITILLLDDEEPASRRK